MRWDDLFDDLAGQAEADSRAAMLGDVDELARDERGRTPWLDRLSARARGVVEMDLVDGSRLLGCTAGAGDGWLAVHVGPDELLVPVHALARVRVPAAQLDASAAPDRLRLGLRVVLRGLARQRAYVRLAASGGCASAGTLDGVGADHLELAEHPDDAPRRTVEVRAVVLVPFEALLWVRYPRPVLTS